MGVIPGSRAEPPGGNVNVALMTSVPSISLHASATAAQKHAVAEGNSGWSAVFKYL